MIVHSDSTLGATLTFVVMLCAFGLLIASVVFVFCSKFSKALKTFATCAGLIAVFVLATAALSALTPQTVVNIGDSYCEDIWCIGIDKVHSAPHGQDILYTLDVHIFSDANRVQTSAKGERLYLFDEKDRHFPLIDDPSVIPYDATLDPGQTIRTTLTFAAPSDSTHLYLWGTGTDPAKPAPFWVRWYFGSVHNILRKPVLIRVL